MNNIHSIIPIDFSGYTPEFVIHKITLFNTNFDYQISHEMVDSIPFKFVTNNIHSIIPTFGPFGHSYL